MDHTSKSKFFAEDILNFIKLIIFLHYSHLNFSYSKHLYKAHDEKLAELIRPIVINISASKNENIESFNCPGNASDSVAVKLFQLYMLLKKFSDMGMELYGDCKSNMKNFYTWVSGGLHKWSQVTVFNAITR